MFPMVIVTKRKLLTTVAERWRATYQRRDEWLPAPQVAATGAVYAALCALPAETTEAQVIALTGDNRWTQNRCHECSVDSAVTVGFAQEAHHPTETTYLCLACLQQAVDRVTTGLQ
ncbi:MAG: hypothetical protein DYG89_20580 [Caldilinea sp. CFX5]|nr:hypothetical protein [Caldilinea sp. CFX5]